MCPIANSRAAFFRWCPIFSERVRDGSPRRTSTASRTRPKLPGTTPATAASRPVKKAVRLEPGTTGSPLTWAAPMATSNAVSSSSDARASSPCLLASRASACSVSACPVADGENPPVPDRNGLGIRRLGAVEIALPETDVAEFHQRPPELAPHPRSQLVARQHGLFLGAIAGARHAQHLGAVLGQLSPQGTDIVLCAKGIEAGTGRLMADVAREALPQAEIAVLSGPDPTHNLVLRDNAARVFGKDFEQRKFNGGELEWRRVQ